MQGEGGGGGVSLGGPLCLRRTVPTWVPACVCLCFCLCFCLSGPGGRTRAGAMYMHMHAYVTCMHIAGGRHQLLEALAHVAHEGAEVVARVEGVDEGLHVMHLGLAFYNCASKRRRRG